MSTTSLETQKQKEQKRGSEQDSLEWHKELEVIAAGQYKDQNTETGRKQNIVKIKKDLLDKKYKDIDPQKKQEDSNNDNNDNKNEDEQKGDGPDENYYISFYKSEEKRGFQGSAFEVDGKVVVAFRGTDDINDKLLSDAPMLFNRMMRQRKDAKAFVNEVIKKYNEKHKNDSNFKELKAKDIVFTGHSLGGSLAQVMACEYEAKAVTFSAYGMEKAALREKYEIHIADDIDEKITNYGSNRDPIFMKNAAHQLGKTLVIVDNHKLFKDGFHSRHKIINYGKLEDAVKYNPAIHKLIRKSVLERKDPTSVIALETIKEEALKEDAHFTEEDLMYISKQAHKGNIMWQKDLDNKVSSGEVFVHSYTKDDGTYVKEYYRSRPSC